jgi:phage gpG-like protein
MFDAQIIGDRELSFKFAELPADLHAAIAAKIAQNTAQLWDKVVKEKLSGQVLNMRSGNLARSIRSETADDGATITGRVYSDGSVPYARIHEFGGTTKAHVIVPSKARALHFIAGGKQVFASMVRHPGSKIPTRSYLRSALAEMIPDFVRGMREAVMEALEKRRVTTAAAA